MVIKVNSTAIQNELGFTSQALRAGRSLTNIRRGRRRRSLTIFIVQCGPDGRADAGGAVLEPVQVGGVTVSRSTLHNMDEVGRLGVQIGDTVLIERAGEVIPHVLKVVKEGKNRKPFHMPKQCPECRSAIHHVEGEVAYRCVNAACPAKRKESLLHLPAAMPWISMALATKLSINSWTRAGERCGRSLCVERGRCRGARADGGKIRAEFARGN